MKNPNVIIIIILIKILYSFCVTIGKNQQKIRHHWILVWKIFCCCCFHCLLFGFFFFLPLVIRCVCGFVTIILSSYHSGSRHHPYRWIHSVFFLLRWNENVFLSFGYRWIFSSNQNKNKNLFSHSRLLKSFLFTYSFEKKEKRVCTCQTFETANDINTCKHLFFVEWLRMNDLDKKLKLKIKNWIEFCFVLFCWKWRRKASKNKITGFSSGIFFILFCSTVRQIPRHSNTKEELFFN